MKFNKFIPLFIFPLLLTGCKTNSLSVDEAKNISASFTHPTTVEARYNNIKVTYSSQMVFDKKNPLGSYFTEGVENRNNIWGSTSDDSFLENPTKKYESQYCRFLSSIPLFINDSFFDEGGKFSTMKLIIYNSYQSYGSIKINKNEYNGLTLSASKVSGEYEFANAIYFEDDDLFDAIKVFGRFNISFVYNNEGFLIKEKIISSNYNTNNDSYIKLESSYEYSH